MADDRDAGTDDERRFRITLPPIRLPEFFPEGFDPAFEPPEQVRTAVASPRTLFAGAVALDAVDAAFALTGNGGTVTTLVVSLLGTVLLGPLGFLNLWEFFTPALAAFPTLSALALLQFRGEFDVFGGGHPEHVEGDAQREGQPEQRDE